MKKSWVVWVVLAVLSLSVLGGGTARAASPDASQWVWASDGWQGGAEPVYIPQGQRVWVDPWDTWSNGSDRLVGPHGYTASQSTGFMPYCKYPTNYTQSLPFGRLIAMTWRSNTDYTLHDAGHAGYLPGPGYLYFRMNERDGDCLKNNYSRLTVDMYAGFIK